MAFRALGTGDKAWTSQGGKSERTLGLYLQSKVNETKTTPPTPIAQTVLLKTLVPGKEEEKLQ